MNRNQSEDNLQAKIWARAWREYPEARRCMWAVPNGSSRNFIEAIKLQATGTLPGVWDLHLFWHGQFYIFELKVGSNTLSTDRVVNGRKIFGQKEWGELMKSHGAKTFIVRTEESFFYIFHNIIKNVPQ